MKTELPSHTMPLELAQRRYHIQDIIKMLKDSQKDGYSGFSLGLIVDLIVRDCNEA
jgi:hypothetical protein